MYGGVIYSPGTRCVSVCVFTYPSLLTLLEPQSRFGDNWGQLTWNLSALSPKRDCSYKRVKVGVLVPVAWKKINVGSLVTRRTRY